MDLLQVSDAQEKLLKGVACLNTEFVPLSEAHLRTAGQNIAAAITQPPFPASAMDGYAVRCDDFLAPDSSAHEMVPSSSAVTLDVIGNSSAGHPFAGTVGLGEAVRIFTGGAVPQGADAIVMQENCETPKEAAINAGQVLVKKAPKSQQFIRPAGYDFHQGDVLVPQGTVLNFRYITLIASMNVPEVPVVRRPRVAILATGDELMAPGSQLEEGQIVSSVPLGMKAMIEMAGGEAELIGIGRDNLDSLVGMIERARGFDVLVTIGGVSVGEHDLVQQALVHQGMALDFWRIAMRPGKPLMVGQLADQRVVGVPGNPVSALICCFMFVLPLIRKMRGHSLPFAKIYQMKLTSELPENGSRQHYMRARISADETSDDGGVSVSSLEDQDSSLQALFAGADALIIRPPHAPAGHAGDMVDVHLLDDIGIS